MGLIVEFQSVKHFFKIFMQQFTSVIYNFCTDSYSALRNYYMLHIVDLLLFLKVPKFLWI